jgi:hypothetical protein
LLVAEIRSVSVEEEEVREAVPAVWSPSVPGIGMKKRGESKEAQRGNAGKNSFSWCLTFSFF